MCIIDHVSYLLRSLQEFDPFVCYKQVTKVDHVEIRNRSTPLEDRLTETF